MRTTRSAALESHEVSRIVAAWEQDPNRMPVHRILGISRENLNAWMLGTRIPALRRRQLKHLALQLAALSRVQELPACPVAEELLQRVAEATGSARFLTAVRAAASHDSECPACKARIAALESAGYPVEPMPEKQDRSTLIILCVGMLGFTGYLFKPWYAAIGACAGAVMAFVAILGEDNVLGL